MGVEQYRRPGRFHHIRVNGQDLFLDVVPNPFGVEIATKWFAKTALAMQLIKRKEEKGSAKRLLSNDSPFVLLLKE